MVGVIVNERHKPASLLNNAGRVFNYLITRSPDQQGSFSVLPSSSQPPPSTFMPSYNGHKAWIQVDGKELPEFDVVVVNPVEPSEEPAVITCWVPSEPDKASPL
jgi:hypothetical protein